MQERTSTETEQTGPSAGGAAPSADTARPTAAEHPAPAQPGAGAARPLRLPSLQPQLPLEQRAEHALSVAQEAFSQTGSWVVFYREVLGPEGVVRKLYPSTDLLRQFETTPQFGTLQEMAAAVRSQDSGKGDEAEPQRMITVRLPRSLHEALKTEAEEYETSINKLCISKLLLPIEHRFVPREQGKRRGRKPGPQGKRNEAKSE